jgi:hypothetical protein
MASPLQHHPAALGAWLPTTRTANLCTKRHTPRRRKRRELVSISLVQKSRQATPSGLFAVYLYNYACLFGTGQAFLPIAYPTIVQLATLITEQLALGVQPFAEAIAVFGQSVSGLFEGATERIQFNDNEFGIRSSELAYRYFVGGFVLVLLDYVVSYIRTRYFYVTKQQERLRQAIEQAANAPEE